MADDSANIKPTDQSQNTSEAVIASNAAECSESSNMNLQTSGLSTETTTDREKSLEFANELMEDAKATLKEGDYAEATDLYSRALEIRVAHYGELAPECVQSYYKFGIALLSKAQDEADPLGAMPKKDAESQQGSANVEIANNNIERESSIASVSSNAQQSASSTKEQVSNDAPSKSEEVKDDKDQESDMEELAEGEEDESDLDLAWKMLDIARAICEKHSLKTMDTVEILSALAEVSLEREDIETSLCDYQKALSILEQLVEPDSRHIVELNFRICLTLEVGSRAQEATTYCQRALSLCKSRMQRLTDELKSTPSPTSSTVASEVGQGIKHSINSQSENPDSDKQSEIESLSSIASDLEKKLEDLQQLESNPKSILSDILELAAAKTRVNEQAAAASSAAASSSRMGVCNGDFDSPTVSTAHTNGTLEVTHLGVVGRGVKRVVMNSGNAESSANKKPDLTSKSGTGDNNGS